MMRGELNARQRKHVYMHSTIFDTDGPTNKSVYAPSRQQELYDELHGKLRRNNREPPEISMPRPADMKCTQHAGHGVVLPSDHDHHQPIEGVTPRATCADAMVSDGDAIKVCKATPHKGRDGHIPKEFWATSVNVQWHDPRNELSRHKAGRNGAATNAQDLKLQEFSSEIFGKERMTAPSTKEPKKELLAETAHIFAKDSSLDPYQQPGARPKGGYPGNDEALDARNHKHRFNQNLKHSQHNSHAVRGQAGPDPVAPPPVEDENPAYLDRRRQEKNFSDLFGVQMGERQPVKGGREEVLASKTCSFLDARSEIAERNKNKWRHDDVHHSVRKEAQLNSHIFEGHETPAKPEVGHHQYEVSNNERVCWDTKDMMHTGSEIARRRRLKDHQGEAGYGPNVPPEVSAYERKLGNMQSEQIRSGIGTVPGPEFSPRSCRPAGEPRRQERLTVNARGTKIASLQSSIFS